MKKGNAFWRLLPYLCAFLGLLFLYRFTFLQADDYTFAVQGRSLESLLFNYLYYYQYAGSRMANLFASALLQGGGLFLWRLLTPAVIEGTAILLSFYVAGPQKGALSFRDVSFTCICALFPGLIPAAFHVFGDTFLWMDGSCNYLYPLFFALVGALPFYCALRGWTLPRFFRVAAPPCFVAGALLHEQMAVFLAAFSAAVLFCLRRQKPQKLLVVLTGLSVLVLLFTLTCPGSYYRLGETVGAETSLLKQVLSHMAFYLFALTGEFWIFTLLSGLCPFVLLLRMKRRRDVPLLVFLGIGMGWSFLGQLFPALRLPETPFSGGTPQNIWEGFLTIFWIAYFVAVFLAYLVYAKRTAKKEFAVLTFSLWASQGIPVVLGSAGRAMYPFFLLSLCLFLRTAWELRGKWVPWAFVVGAVFALGMLGRAYLVSSQNAEAYAQILQQVTQAKAGVSQVVVFDPAQFDDTYTYWRAFFAPYERYIRAYFSLPDTVELQFLPGKETMS